MAGPVIVWHCVPKAGVHLRTNWVCTLLAVTLSVSPGLYTLSTPRPPPKKRQRNPNKSANKSADRFFSKTVSQCPGSQSQAPNTPSLWLLNSWSHVETQNISQFSKQNFLSLGSYMVPELWCGSAQGWSSGICHPQHFIGVGSIPTVYKAEFFGTFFHLSC